MNKEYKSRMWLAGAEVMGVVALVAIAGWLLPWVEALKTVAALVVAYVIPRVIYRRSDCEHLAGCLVLPVAWLALCSVAIPFLHRCTVGSGASFAMPCLVGDAANYYDWALSRYDGSAVEPTVTFWGYSILIIGLWKVLGVSVIWPVAMNVMATLLTIVLTGRLAARLSHVRQSLTAAMAMAMLAVQGYFMSQGAQMLKEPWIYLAVTLMACGLLPSSGAGKGGRTDRDVKSCDVRRVLVYTVGCFMLAAVRAKYVNFMFIGILMLAVAGRMRQWRHYAFLLTITALCWWLGMAMTDHYTVIQQVNNVTGDGGMADMFSPEGPYQKLLGDYFRYPAWHKVWHLPLTCAVQWLIPFPWLPRGEETTWLHVAPRLRLGWYVLSGVVMYFYLFRSWRRGWRWAAWAWFPMVCFAGIAYMTSGTVSRYILPFQPWWMALAAVTVVQCGRSRSLYLFAATYLLALGVVLAVCHQLTC